MVDRFTCEDAIILLLGEFPDSSTAFIRSRVTFHGKYTEITLAKLEERGIVRSRETQYSSNRRRDGTEWKLPNRPHPEKAVKKWSLVDDGEGRSPEDQG
jgi:hypothetical protein